MNKNEDIVEGIVNKYGCFPTDTEFGKAVDKACAKFMEELTPTLDAMPTAHLVIAGHYADRMVPQFLAGYILKRQLDDSKERRDARMNDSKERRDARMKAREERREERREQRFQNALKEIREVREERERGDIE